MPGGRLHHEERRLIAAGLAAGHGYAEIARQLDRPTSTISREVARNGGARGYRADHAHHATNYRARRRGPAAGVTSVPDVDAYGRNVKAVREYAEQFAATLISTGLSRMASRVLAFLYTADSGSLTAAELVRELQVSAASISKAIGYLENLELVRREPDPERRHEHYIVTEELWVQAWKTSARANARWAETALKGVELLDPATPAGARLAKMSQFFQQLSDDMAGNGPASAAAEDAMTILAALIQAGRPLSSAQLAMALGWKTERTAEALQTAEAYKLFTDPVQLEIVAPDTYTVCTPRLTEAQLRSLTGELPDH
jgi:DNA-binding MarR family transcriptional regulator